MNINWITIKVKDLAESKKFYHDYLGMKFESEFSPNEFLTIAFFEADNGMKVELIHDRNTAAANLELTNSISVGITSSQYDKLLKQAKEKNIITVEPAIMGGHMECFFISDPNGLSIQIIKQ